MEGEDDRLESYSMPALPRRQAHDRLALRCVRLSRPGRLQDGSDGIAHTQLTFGDGMIMLGSLRDDRFSQVQSTPAALGGTTQSPYLSSPMPIRSIKASLLLEPRSSSRSK